MFGKSTKNSATGSASRSTAPKYYQSDDKRTKLPDHLRDPSCEEKKKR